MRDFGQMALGLERPTTPEEQLRIQSDVSAMRRAITYGRRDSSLIARCLQIAEIQGLSGEETMTMLAYNALVELEGSWQRCMKLSALNIREQQIFPPEKAP